MFEHLFRVVPVRSAALTLAAGSLAVALSSCGEGTDFSKPGGSKEYTYGTKISFAQSGAATSYQVSGWSKPEPQFTWTEGDTAVLAIRVPASDAPVVLRARGAGFLNPPELTIQPIEVLVNEKKVAEWQVGDASEYTAMIPPEMVKSGGVLTITFKMPKAISPKAAGQTEDPRVLGFSVHEIELRKVG
jgi:hypothetical protein